MDLVTDTSAIIVAIIDEPEKQAVIRYSVGSELIVPPSVHWEIGNAFSAMLKRRRTSLTQAYGADCKLPTHYLSLHRC